MATKKVILDAPGIVACGDYRAGVVYEVDAEEAKRLIEVKGFRAVAKDDKAEPAGKKAGHATKEEG